MKNKRFYKNMLGNIELAESQIVDRLEVERDMVQFLYEHNLLGDFSLWQVTKTARNL